jgi:hypothetical protein
MFKRDSAVVVPAMAGSTIPASLRKGREEARRVRA